MKKCPMCGDNANVGETVCKSCGGALDEKAELIANAESPEMQDELDAGLIDAGDPPLWIAPIVVAAVALVGAFFLPVATYLCFLVLLVMFLLGFKKKRRFPVAAMVMIGVAMAGAIINSVIAFQTYTIR